jgi:serine/threonine protein kinase
LQEDNEFFEKYEILGKIGEGGHSSVYKCEEKESGKLFAVKITRFRDEEMIVNSKKQF